MTIEDVEKIIAATDLPFGVRLKAKTAKKIAAALLQAGALNTK